MISNNKVIDVEDIFNFNCKMCGSCCENMLIKLSPYDIISFAKGLEISTNQFINEYAVLLKLKDSGFYIVALRHVRNGVCIFKQGKKCSLYNFRSLACRLFPLGRNEQDIFIQKTKYCKGFSANKENTASSWIEQEKAEKYLIINREFNNFVLDITSKYNFNKLDKRNLNLFNKFLYDYSSLSQGGDVEIEDDLDKARFCMFIAKWFIEKYNSTGLISEMEFYDLFQVEVKRFVESKKHL